MPAQFTNEHQNNAPQVLGNIKARHAFETLVELVPDILASMPGAGAGRFWELVATHAAAQIGMQVVPAGKVRNDTPMTEQEAHDFARSAMPWGANKGVQISEVDPHYLAVITEGRFGRELARYVASPYFRRIYEG